MSGLAGCLGIGNERSPRPTETAAVADTAGGTAELTTSPGNAANASAPPGDLDPREANVLAVGYEPVEGGYRFAVTLSHDDEGEPGYADWWQVETVDGERLGRRELLHAHATQPFTRSATVEVPDDVTCVVVRGHDQTHGYGGQLLVLDLESGAAQTFEQGPEPLSLDASYCPPG